MFSNALFSAMGASNLLLGVQYLEECWRVKAAVPSI